MGLDLRLQISLLFLDLLLRFAALTAHRRSSEDVIFIHSPELWFIIFHQTHWGIFILFVELGNILVETGPSFLKLAKVNSLGFVVDSEFLV